MHNFLKAKRDTIRSLPEPAYKFQKIILLFLVLIPLLSNSQDNDVKINKENTTSSQQDTVKQKIHDPTKATIYSMIIPGLGQAYNHKYWKIPIIYAGFGTLYYFISFNNTEYKKWRDAYYHSLVNQNGDEPPVNDYERLYGSRPDVLKSQKDYYRRNRDLSYILTGVWYLLNVVDATVDANLYTWNVDDNLSIRFEPTLTSPLYGYRPNGGLKLSLHFK